MQKHLEQNNTPRKNKHRIQRVRRSVLIGAIVGLFLVSPGSIATALLSVAIGGVSGYLIMKAHEVYLQFCASYYDVPKREDFRSNGEQKAFLAGLTSKKLINYLVSFTNKTTYQHPCAFGAGLFYAYECKPINKQAIDHNASPLYSDSYSFSYSGSYRGAGRRRM